MGVRALLIGRQALVALGMPIIIGGALTEIEIAASLGELRRACRMQTQTLCDALAELVRAGRDRKSDAGDRLA